ncbi:MFS transporter [Candidatus Woesearchaeota archaeon]|nr:MFS transporter [Candidatus Woesearchaeota archaeon]
MKEGRNIECWRNKIFWSIWISYAAYYLCRVNMSVALPGIMKEFDVSKTTMGVVLSAFFATYAAGQFINGQIGDKFGGRTMISMGILTSAVLNLIFGFTNGFLGSMILVWALNGVFQSMGWSSSVKTVANWFPLSMRTKRAGMLGTSYQFGSAASWALSGFVVGMFGWRWAFFIPAIVCAVIGMNWLIFGKNAPEEAGFSPVEEHEKKNKNGKITLNGKISKDEHLGFKFTLLRVLTKKRIWAAALALCGLNVIRYGFMDWAPTYLFEVQKAAISTAAYKALIIPLAGILGALFAAYAAEKFFAKRKAPIATIMLFLLAIACWVFPRVPHGDWMLSLFVMACIGFLTYGPHVLIVTAMPMDFGSRKAAASATGFIDGWGYIGAALTGVGTGWLVDTFGWNAAFYFWILGAVGAGIVMSVLWAYNIGEVKGKYH